MWLEQRAARRDFGTPSWLRYHTVRGCDSKSIGFRNVHTELKLRLRAARSENKQSIPKLTIDGGPKINRLAVVLFTVALID